MVEILKSRNSFPTLKVKGIFLHSSFDPMGEAEKYLKTKIKAGEGPSAVLLLTPGLNYLYDVLRKHFPDVKIINLHAGYEIYKYAKEKYDDNTFSWYPESDLPCSLFLKKFLDEEDLPDLMVLEWPPAKRMFLEEGKNISRSLLAVLNEYNGNIATNSAFGKRWFSNCINNILSIKKIMIPEKIDMPVVITASGVSLSDSESFLKKNRNKFFLIALSSSLSFLTEKKIIPDIALSTDPGYYSVCHLNRISEAVQGTALALSSYCNCDVLASHPVLLINQDNFSENFFLKDLDIPHIDLRSHGTVAGTALYMAEELGSEKIFITGLDMCAMKGRTHVFPNFFDSCRLCRSKRTGSYMDMIFKEIAENFKNKNGIEISRTFDTYASWFNSFRGKKIFRINPSDVEMGCFDPISLKEAEKIFSDHPEKKRLYFKTAEIENKTIKKAISEKLERAVSFLEMEIESIKAGNKTTQAAKKIIYNLEIDKYLSAEKEQDEKEREKILRESMENIKKFIDKKKKKIESF